MKKIGDILFLIVAFLVPIGSLLTDSIYFTVTGKVGPWPPIWLLVNLIVLIRCFKSGYAGHYLAASTLSSLIVIFSMMAGLERFIISLNYTDTTSFTETIYSIIELFVPINIIGFNVFMGVVYIITLYIKKSPRDE